MSLEWLAWAQQLQAIAQNRFTYCENPYDLERYGQVRQIAAEILATHADVEPNFVCNLFEREEGYATPKVDVRAAVFQGDILLVKEREDGCWTLPGGWVEASVWVKHLANISRLGRSVCKGEAFGQHLSVRSKRL